MLPNYYSILRIHPGTSAEEIRAANRRWTKQHHPVACGSLEAFQF
jgi:DnaJ-class molecular chaperone